MNFRSYITEMMKGSFSSSLALGLVLGVLVIGTGGAEGEISLDIGLSATDSLWFFFGVPAVISALFLLLSPLSYFIHAAVFRREPVKPSDDV
jgi:hypothetical protein